MFFRVALGKSSFEIAADSHFSVVVDEAKPGETTTPLAPLWSLLKLQQEDAVNTCKSAMKVTPYDVMPLLITDDAPKIADLNKSQYTYALFIEHTSPALNYRLIDDVCNSRHFLIVIFHDLLKSVNHYLSFKHTSGKCKIINSGYYEYGCKTRKIVPSQYTFLPIQSDRIRYAFLGGSPEYLYYKGRVFYADGTSVPAEWIIHNKTKRLYICSDAFSHNIAYINGTRMLNGDVLDLHNYPVMKYPVGF